MSRARTRTGQREGTRARPKASRRGELPTRTLILDEAERLAQTRGFNGFSYADVARVLGTTKAALHYHFPSKAELGRALVERYADRFFEAVSAIDAQGGSAGERLRAYARLYGDVVSDGRLCLCGMLAAEYATLGPPMRKAVLSFFERNEDWLSALLESGRSAGTLRFRGDTRDLARAIVSGLEGAMLLARAYGEPSHVDSAAAHLIGDLVGTR